MQSTTTPEDQAPERRVRWVTLLIISISIVFALVLGLAFSERLLDSCASLHLRGQIYLWTQDYEKALTYFEKIALRQPDSAKPWIHRGLAHSSLEQWAEAAEAYQQATKLQPENAQTLYRLGYAHVRLGNRDAAKQAHETLGRLSQGYANRLANYISLMK